MIDFKAAAAHRRRVTFDFETRSKSNLKLEGAYKYSLDPSTQPTCMAYKLKGRKGVTLLKFETINTPWEKLPEEFRNEWMTFICGDFLFCAHNAFFERCIYVNILVRRYGWPPIELLRYRCTAAKAAAHALPRNLEGAGLAMKLKTQKDVMGRAAMMATCKPVRAWNAWMKARAEIAAGKRVGPKKRTIAAGPEPKVFLDYEEDPATWEVLYRYCKIDVIAEELLDDSLDDLIPQEQEIWHLNQKLNWRGLKIDIPTVKKVKELMARESKIRLKELDELTLGLITKPGSIKSILAFLEEDDIILPNLRAKTIEDVLAAGNISEDGKKLLKIRQALSKTSTKKYEAFLNRANADGRVRDILMYHGASTGRDTGTGIQPHNFPKGLIKIDKRDPYRPVRNVIECDEGMLHFYYGETLAILFSSILRNMIMPDDGYDLYVADFAKIEVVVCFWLANNEPGLKILRAGKDLYIHQAAMNTGKKYEEILDPSFDRDLGKAQTLGCQFGMGWKKFQSTAWDFYRLKLTAAQSRAAVKSYREENPAVPEMWAAVERAAIAVVREATKLRWVGRTKTIEAGKCKFYCEKNFLFIELPSGRRLAYRDPALAWRMREYEVEIPIVDKFGKAKLDEEGEPQVRTETRWSGPHETLEFMAVNSKTKKWNAERTWGGVIWENIVQGCARDLMMLASVRLEKKGYEFLLAVHDEGLTQKKHGEGSVEEFTKLLCQRPPWGLDIPIEAKGWKGSRYRK